MVTRIVTIVRNAGPILFLVAVALAGQAGQRWR